MLESFPYVMFHDLITMSQHTPVLYILTSVWMLRMPNAVFDVFNNKKLKKEKKARNLQQNLAQKNSFLSLHQNAARMFYSPKTT